MGALETLSNVNVVTNTLMLYFTHVSYKVIFVAEDELKLESGSVSTDVEASNIALELAQFLFILIVTEHIIIGIKMLIQFINNGYPAFVA